MALTFKFGDHTLFLRKDVLSFNSLPRAFFDTNYRGGVIYVFEGAESDLLRDGYIGGTIIAIFDFPTLMERIRLKNRNPAKSARPHTLLHLERYIRKFSR